MPDGQGFVSRRQRRWAFATGQYFARRWARESRGRRLPETKAQDEEIARAQAVTAAPANTGTPGKRSRSEVARLAALARWGKYKGGGKKPAPKKGKKAAQTPEQKEAARRQEAQANRSKVLSELGLAEDAAGALDDLAMGKPTDDDGGLEKMGLAERGKDGTLRLTAAGRAFYNAASRGDVGAAKDTLGRGKDSAATQAERAKAKADKDAAAEEETPKAGGGGGGGGKPSDEDKERERKEKADAKRQAARETVKEKMRDSDTGLSPSGFDAFAGFADGGDLSSTAARQLGDMGLVEGDPPRLTEAGRGLRNAIDRGDYRGAVDAIGRGTDRKRETADRERVKTERAADQQKRQTARQQARDLLEKRRRQEAEARENGRNRITPATKDADMDDDLFADDTAIKQTASERAMFANMGGSGGGGGGSAGGGKPSGGTGGLWAVNPATGKREPGQGLAKGAVPPPAGGERAKKLEAAQDGKPSAADRSPLSDGAVARFTRSNSLSQPEIHLLRQAQRNGSLTEGEAQRAIRVANVLAESRGRSRTTSDFAEGMQLARGSAADVVKGQRDGAAMQRDRAARARSDAAQAKGRKKQDLLDIAVEYDQQAKRQEKYADDIERALASVKSVFMDYADILDSLVDAAEALEEDSATKAGRRNSAADQAIIQAICEAACDVVEMACALGAEMPDDEDEEDETVEDAMDMSVKMLADDRVGGYAIRFGSSDEPDLSAFRDFFTKSTDFWLDAWATRPMLYHHAQDEATKDAPVVGRWTQARVDDVGVWLEGQLDTAHRYAGAVKELIRRGVLRLSSDSAPHLVVREPQPNHTNWVKRWPLLAASLTPSPAEPRLTPVGALKAAYLEAGLLPPAELDEETDADSGAAIDNPEAIETTAIEAQADPLAEMDRVSERERLLALELDLLALEA